MENKDGPVEVPTGERVTVRLEQTEADAAFAYGLATGYREAFVSVIEVLILAGFTVLLFRSWLLETGA